MRIHHELRSDDVESWKVFNKVLDSGTNSSRDHIDLCNATEIIRNRKLGDLIEMTWRWVIYIIFIGFDSIMTHVLSMNYSTPVIAVAVAG